MPFPFLKTANALSVLINGRPMIIPETHPNYNEVLAGVLADTLTADEIEEKVSIRTFVAKVSRGNVRIEGDTVWFKERQLDGLLVDRLVEAVKENAEERLNSLLAFTESLNRNPSRRIREQLYPFLEKGLNPITATGGFLAYKRVRDDYLDVHSGKIRNKPGDTPTMDRTEVDDDPNRTCSHGLHVCNYDYLRSFPGDRVVLVEVMPEDVVSVPSDYDSTKMRTCRYRVLEDVTERAREDGFFDEIGLYYEPDTDYDDDDYSDEPNWPVWLHWTEAEEEKS
jgi:hypothetical protein